MLNAMENFLPEMPKSRSLNFKCQWILLMSKFKLIKEQRSVLFPWIVSHTHTRKDNEVLHVNFVGSPPITNLLYAY